MSQRNYRRDNPSLELLKKQAKRLHTADSGALADVQEFHPKPAALAGDSALAGYHLLHCVAGTC